MLEVQSIKGSDSRLNDHVSNVNSTGHRFNPYFVITYFQGQSYSDQVAKIPCYSLIL